MRKERENNVKAEKKIEGGGKWERHRDREKGEKSKNVKLKFTLTDYISDELAMKSTDESTTIRKKKLYKIVFNTREKERVFLKRNERALWLSKRKLQNLSLVTTIFDFFNNKKKRTSSVPRLPVKALPLHPNRNKLEVVPKTTLCRLKLETVWPLCSLSF